MEKKHKSDDELLKVSKEHLEVSKRHLEVSKEHRDIGKEQLKTSMPKKEQRLWQIIVILVMIIIGGGIYIKLGIGNNKAIPNEYDVKVEVSPNEIRLNDKQDKEFTFTFTNIGTKNLTSFEVTDIILYRLEKGTPTYLYPAYSNRDGSKLECHDYNLGLNKVALPVGNKCTLTVKMWGMGCERCFDDKDKTPQFYVYFQALPFVEDKIVNLTIY